MNIFFEIFQGLPRGGPGDAGSTRKAFFLLTSMPRQARILDIGCGPGMQTIELAKMTDGNIVALDTHQPFLDNLSRQAEGESLSEKIAAHNASMFDLPFDKRSFDAIWSEGAIYIIGFERGLREWQPFLKEGGYLAVTELSWLQPNPPVEVSTFWQENYPGMKNVDENLGIIQRTGYREIGHFILPESSWWENYYHPMEKRIAFLRKKYPDDAEARKYLDESQKEIDLYRKYSKWYGYVFFIMQIGGSI